MFWSAGRKNQKYNTCRICLMFTFLKNWWKISVLICLNALIVCYIYHFRFMLFKPPAHHILQTHPVLLLQSWSEKCQLSLIRFVFIFIEPEDGRLSVLVREQDEKRSELHAWIWRAVIVTKTNINFTIRRTFKIFHKLGVSISTLALASRAKTHLSLTLGRVRGS